MDRETIDWLPRAVRQRVNLWGSAHWEDGTAARVLVSNISYEGCHLWSDHEFCMGETLHLILPNYGKINGQVRWIADGNAGIRFLIGSAVDDRRARIGV